MSDLPRTLWRHPVFRLFFYPFILLSGFLVNGVARGQIRFSSDLPVDWSMVSRHATLFVGSLLLSAMWVWRKPLWKLWRNQWIFRFLFWSYIFLISTQGLLIAAFILSLLMTFRRFFINKIKLTAPYLLRVNAKINELNKES